MPCLPDRPQLDFGRGFGKEVAVGEPQILTRFELKELARRLSDLPRDRQIVAYCRGPYSVLAVEAVGMLRAHGFEAWRMEHSCPGLSGRRVSGRRR